MIPVLGVHSWLIFFFSYVGIICEYNSFGDQFKQFILVANAKTLSFMIKITWRSWQQNLNF